jgi:hypothetical protein
MSKKQSKKVQDGSAILIKTIIILNKMAIWICLLFGIYLFLKITGWIFSLIFGWGSKADLELSNNNTTTGNPE